MFNLENILSYANANIQIIGVFIAIIGGLIATKLLNAKIEKDTLEEKLIKINKEIRFYENKNIKDKDKLYKINKEDYIYYIHDKIRKKDFNVEDYSDYNLTVEQRNDIVDELNEMIEEALNIFKEEHSREDIPKILKDNHIQEGTIKYYIYDYVGKMTRKRKYLPFGMIDPSDIDFDIPRISSLSENLLERDLNTSISENEDFLSWKLIEKEDIESKIRGISKNLNNKYDIVLFILITIFAIIIPQIIISIHPIFINFKWLKYPFGVYSILTFIISMILMLKYICNLFISINKN